MHPLLSNLGGVLGFALAASAAATPAHAAPSPAVPANTVTLDTIRELAPTGTLRVAINLGNPVLAQSDAASGELGGVSVALARELARQLGVPVAFITFPGAGQVSQALPDGRLDIAFMAIDPVRAANLVFTPPYVLIEGTYMVANSSKLTDIAGLDQPGLRIAVGKGSAYDLFLTRTLQHAELVRAPTSEAAVALFRTGGADAVAGVRQPLEKAAQADPAMHVIPGRFMRIEQAMATPHGRPAGSAFLRGFVEQAKASGFVAAALASSGQTDAEIAPPAQP